MARHGLPFPFRFSGMPKRLAPAEAVQEWSAGENSHHCNLPVNAEVVKALTPDQLESRKEKAVRFARDVLGDPDRADEIGDESLEDYAARRKIEIVDNPHLQRLRRVERE